MVGNQNLGEGSSIPEKNDGMRTFTLKVLETINLEGGMRIKFDTRPEQGWTVDLTSKKTKSRPEKWLETKPRRRNENYSFLKNGWKLNPGEGMRTIPEKGLETKPRRRNENYS